MRTTVTIIGGGQAGLAMSRTLANQSIDHVVIERGTAGQSWRSERWDSLRLLTPNWMTRLPGHQYQGDDPDGFMPAADVANFLANYARISAAPIVEHTTVSKVEPVGCHYNTVTDQGTWTSRCVVVATGACSTPKLPKIAAAVPDRIEQLSPIHYRNPSQISGGHTLVVGASASGAQLADELARAGHRVTLAVSDHVRLPRTYRGMDIHWWMNAVGRLDEHINEVDDPLRARRVPSLQLIGTPEKRCLGLNELAEQGVQLVGRLAGVSGGQLQFSGSFANSCTSADLKQNRLLDLIDTWMTERGLDAHFDEPNRPSPTRVPAASLGMPVSDVDRVIWATGFAPTYPWLPDPVKNARGALDHDGGVLPLPGMYAMGLPFMRRRKSAFLDGVAQDATDVGRHLIGHLNQLVSTG